MDPNEALRVLREAMAYAQRQMDNDTDHPSFCVVSNRTVSDMLDSFTALDEWLTRGGFRPTEWSN
jgi:hypothetical protein